MHMFDTKIALILQRDNTQQIITGNPTKGQTQRLNRVQGICFTRLFVN